MGCPTADKSGWPYFPQKLVKYAHILLVFPKNLAQPALPSLRTPFSDSLLGLPMPHSLQLDK